MSKPRPRASGRHLGAQLGNKSALRVSRVYASASMVICAVVLSDAVRGPPVIRMSAFIDYQ